MAAKYIYIALVFCVTISFGNYLCSAEDSPPAASIDNELHLNGIPPNPTNPTNPTSPTNNRGNTDHQIQPPNNLMAPVEDVEDVDDNDDAYEQGNQQFQIFPFQFFQRRDPISSIFDALRRHRINLDQQFSQLERQAGEGQDISYFFRNGVQYVRTCVTKRVQPQDMQKPTETS